jgi:hypothetical protein
VTYDAARALGVNVPVINYYFSIRRPPPQRLQMARETLLTKVRNYWIERGLEGLYDMNYEELFHYRSNLSMDSHTDPSYYRFLMLWKMPSRDPRDNEEMMRIIQRILD